MIIFINTGLNNATRINTTKTMEIGLVKKYWNSPVRFVMTNVCLQLLSAIGPRIIARTTGAVANPYLRMK